MIGKPTAPRVYFRLTFVARAGHTRHQDYTRKTNARKAQRHNAEWKDGWRATDIQRVRITPRPWTTDSGTSGVTYEIDHLEYV